MKSIVSAVLVVAVAAIAVIGGATFLEKCRSDIQLSKNAGRIADALERMGKK